MREKTVKMESSLDATLSEQARQLFQLDQRSQRILSAIASKGPMTVYQLGKETEITRQTIYRRLKGEEGLLEQKFLTVVKVEEFEAIKGLRKKFFGLTLKGLFATLRDVRLESIYLTKNFFEVISERYRSLVDAFKIKIGGEAASIADLVALYVKAEIALWFQCHLENGLNLTSIKDVQSYYLSTRNVSEIFKVIGYSRYDEKGNIILASGHSDIRKELMIAKTRPIEALHEMSIREFDVLGDMSFWPFILEPLSSEWGKKNVDRIFDRIPSTTLELYPAIPGDITIKDIDANRPHIIVSSSVKYIDLKARKERSAEKK